MPVGLGPASHPNARSQLQPLLRDDRLRCLASSASQCLLVAQKQAFRNGWCHVVVVIQIIPKLGRLMPQTPEPNVPLTTPVESACVVLLVFKLGWRHALQAAAKFQEDVWQSKVRILEALEIIKGPLNCSLVNHALKQAKNCSVKDLQATLDIVSNPKGFCRS